MRHYADPTRNGEFMVVSLCLRRSGPVNIENIDAPVIKLRILRQQRLKMSGSNVVVDSRGERFVRFSFIPRTDVDNPAYDDYPLRRIGVDTLPRLFLDLDLQSPTEESTIESKLDGDSYPYEEMPLALSAETPTSLAGREIVWQFMRDVRAEEEGINPEVPDIREEIVITNRMLGVLPDDPSTTLGAGEDQYDGESGWTIFDGLVVFGSVDPNAERKRLFVYDDQNIDSNLISYGLSPKHPNLTFVKDGPRGNASHEYDEYPGAITDLNLEVEYLGGAGVDIDYVTFQTPNTRALLRDQYRSRVSRQIAETITQLGKELIKDTTLIAKNFTIFGIRSHEEEGELCWYGQRYLNILTSGLMISEIDNKPYERYQHIAYPFARSSGSYPDHPLPLWVWNEGSTGRLDPFTPVPFLRNGAANRGNYYTYGYKYGLSRGQYYKNNTSDPDNLHHGDTAKTVDGWLKIGAASVLTATGMQNRRMATDDYSIGYPCNEYSAGDADGQLALFRDAFSPGRKPQLWHEPRWLEHPDLDGLTENNADTSPSCSDLDIGVQLSTIDRPSTLKLSTSLYGEFMTGGNTTFLFDRLPWLEQVWLGTDKVGVHWPVINQSDSLATVLMSRGDQSRPYTAEEMRIRLITPTLLGARGVMLFVGTFPTIRDTVQTMMRIGFPNVTNARAYHDAKMDTFSVNSLLTDHYGADYPTFRPGGWFIVDTNYSCANCGVNLRKDLVWKVRSEGYLEGGSMVNTTNGPEPDKLYFSTLGYISGGGKSQDPGGTWVTDPTDTIGGVRLVQRVNSDGTINSNAKDVERVYLGHHSVRLELLRYTNWLQGSFLNGFNVNWYDTIYQSIPGEHEVVGGTSGSSTFNIGDLTYTSPASVAELLARLDLYSWHNRGYGEFNSWRDKDSVANPLAEWIDLGRIKTRHPYRTFNGRADYEAADSMFVDVMLHKRRLDIDTLAYMDEVYLGVSNRRDNPLYMQDPDTTVAFDDQPRFSSTREFYAMVSKPENKHRIYDQLGSRSVLLPFTHAKTATLARKVETAPGVYTTQSYTTPILLHITEVVGGSEEEREYETLYRNPQDSTQTLRRRRVDTIIDPKAAFELSLLPGEGKLLRVRPIPALSTDDIKGNLAFSTQTKLVVAPEQYYDSTNSRWVRTDKVRYHMAYTKSLPICGLSGEPFLRVCYRRSIPYPRDYVPTVSGLQWEQNEHVFGSAFEVVDPGIIGNNRPGTWWLAGVPRFPGKTSDTMTRVHPCIPNDRTIRIQAGFPSIAISRSIIDSGEIRDTIQRVHVVYSALYNKGIDMRTGEHHIVETSFIDGVSNVSGSHKSYSLSVIQYNAADTISIDTMLAWGTPTNGIAQAPDYDTTNVTAFRSDRLMTAWSIGRGRGIAASMRNVSLDSATRPMEHYLLDPYAFPDQSNTEEIMLTQTLDSADLPQRRAQFPSLTPTASPVGKMVPAASLVWQEQAVEDEALHDSFNGWAVMYTRLWDRLWHDTTDPFDFGVPDGVDQVQYIVSGVPALVRYPAGMAAAGDSVTHHVLRISDDDPGRVSIYPTIVRSGEPQMKVWLSDSLGITPPVMHPFQFETVTFQTMKSAVPTAFIHRRHFIQQDECTGNDGPGDGLHYWWLGSTSIGGTNLVAPTLALGSVRLDEQEYIGTATAPYSPVRVNGNVSDTAIITVATAVTDDLLRMNPNDVPSGTVHWLTWNTPRTIWYAHLKYTPIPVHGGGFVAYGNSSANSDRSASTSGIWPHLAHQMLGVDQAKQNVRRIQQDTGSPASSPIFVSAEGFYKRDFGPKWRTKGGYHNGQDVISLGGIMNDGEELTFRRLERPGSPLESMVASIFAPIPDLVSEVFTVENVKDLQLDIDGLLREDVELYIEQVGLDGSAMQGRSVNVGLPERPERDAKTQRKMSRWTLSNGGDGNMYRIRLHPTGAVVVMEDEILEDLTADFAKTIDNHDEREVIDLQRLHVGSASSMMSVMVIPNPVRSTMSIVPVVPSYITAPLQLDIVDAIGQRVLSTEIAPAATTTLDVGMLPSGTYVVHITSTDGLVARTVYTVVR